MPYGSMDKSTEDILRSAGIDPDALAPQDDAGAAMSVDILFDGALDESFLVDVDADYRAVVDAIADALIGGFPDNDVQVDANHVYIGEDYIEGSGYLDDYYVRRSASEER